ncbi:MAG TPA: 16S rRNA (cytidine(1402)-2'-O)-methyltransferase [Candidatus Obscuribacterales bacterium]
MSGTLFIVSTPIGNLGDISPRVKDALFESAIVLAEDTRVTQKLLFHLGIKTPLVSCHEHNERGRFNVIEQAAASDTAVALVSDAGTPLVSDPGYQIVRKAIELGLKVVPIPGASAALAALVGSGLPSDRFTFEGFLPDKTGDRMKRLEKCRDGDRTLIFFIAPSNLATVLGEMCELFGDRPACLGRELTKLHEEFIRGSLSRLKQHIEENGTRGEYVLVVGGADGAKKATQEAVQARLEELLSGGAKLKEASSILSRETGWPSSQIYKLGLAFKQGSEPEA